MLHELVLPSSLGAQPCFASGRVEEHLCSVLRAMPFLFCFEGNSAYIPCWPVVWDLRSNKSAKGCPRFSLQAVGLCWVGPKCSICLEGSEQPAESWGLAQLVKACANGKGAYGRSGEGKLVLGVAGELRFLWFS